MSPTPPLSTPRLHLRPLLLSDTQAIFDLRTDPQVRQYIKRSPMSGLEDARAFIDNIRDGEQTGKFRFWAICKQEQPDLIGTICFWNFSSDRREAELGYELLPTYHRQGIMGEAMQSVLDFGFSELSLQRILAFTQLDNIASKTLLLQQDFRLLANRSDPNNPKNGIFALTSPS